MQLAKAIVGIALVTALGYPAGATAQTCSPVTVGMDSSYANGSESSVALGEALGQTFYASDTLIESVTIYRYPTPNPNDEGWHLLILGTDSAGAPNTANIIMDGPTSYAVNGDGVHPVAINFEFSPPFALPHPGEYELAFLGDPCDGTAIQMINGNNAYSGGCYWLHPRSAIIGCKVRSGPLQLADWDMIFQIRFCELAVPAESGTWGSIKARYR